MFELDSRSLGVFLNIGRTHKKGEFPWENRPGFQRSRCENQCVVAPLLFLGSASKRCTPPFQRLKQFTGILGVMWVKQYHKYHY